MKIYLETERILLRELEPNDLKELINLDSDPSVMKYLTDGQPNSSEIVRNSLDNMIRLLKTHNGQFGFWAAIKKDTDDFLGWFHLRPDKNNPLITSRVELGYRLKKQFWGNGFATEGSLALIKKAFNELNVKSVFAITMADNTGSRRVMEKIGMKLIKEFYNPDFPGTTELDVEYEIKH